MLLHYGVTEFAKSILVVQYFSFCLLFGLFSMILSSISLIPSSCFFHPCGHYTSQFCILVITFFVFV